MNKRAAQHLAHAENRIRYCLANIANWSDSCTGDAYQVELATAQLYSAIGAAQEQHQEDHF